MQASDSHMLRFSESPTNTSRLSRHTSSASAPPSLVRLPHPLARHCHCS
uniref:Uncharacterized protein n=1 Tax=Arundo donax TaxID=35708 RepID=A0A0A9KXS6_ARUDO